jgi:hypothetical protein
LKDVFWALWKNFNATFDDILRRIRSHKAFVMDKATTMYSQRGLFATDMQDIRNHIQQYERDRLQFLDTEKERQAARYNEVQEWIASADVESEHYKICYDLENYPNCGDWILNQQKVKNWLSPDGSTHSILWINGRPGTGTITFNRTHILRDTPNSLYSPGKTYLAAIIIEACKKNTSWVTSYFYHSKKSENRSTAISIFRGILSQLVRQHNELVPYCYEKKRNSDSPTLSSLPPAKTILNTFCERIPNLYIIIDAIDECESSEQRKFVLDIFKDLVKKSDGYSSGKLRVLFLSQSTPEIKDALPSADILTLTPEDNKKGIWKYCQLRIREMRKFKLNKDEIKAVVEMTCARADGKLIIKSFLIATISHNS